MPVLRPTRRMQMCRPLKGECMRTRAPRPARTTSRSSSAGRTSCASGPSFQLLPWTSFDKNTVGGCGAVSVSLLGFPCTIGVPPFLWYTGTAKCQMVTPPVTICPANKKFGGSVLGSGLEGGGAVFVFGH